MRLGPPAATRTAGRQNRCRKALHRRRTPGTAAHRPREPGRARRVAPATQPPTMLCVTCRHKLEHVNTVRPVASTARTVNEPGVRHVPETTVKYHLGLAGAPRRPGRRRRPPQARPQLLGHDLGGGSSVAILSGPCPPLKPTHDHDPAGSARSCHGRLHQPRLRGSCYRAGEDLLADHGTHGAVAHTIMQEHCRRPSRELAETARARPVGACSLGKTGAMGGAQTWAPCMPSGQLGGGGW
jgi:hypothetical protein